MNPGNLIKNIIEKIKLWYKNWLKKFKKKEKIQNYDIPDNIEYTTKKYTNKVFFVDDNKNSSINTIYPKASREEIENLHKKINLLRKKVISDEFDNYINYEKIDIRQVKKLNLLCDKAIDNEITLSKEDLNLIKENLSIIVDKKFNEYEINIINKAYKEYKEVNYVIMTTLIIDDIIDKIENLKKDFYKNKYSTIEYKQKIDKIKEKIEEIETINNSKEVLLELDKLKKDFYTKKKDKYDLLYNNEIFVNLDSQCNELLNLIHKKEKDRKVGEYKKRKREEAIEKEKNNQKKRIEEEKRKRKKEQQLEEENIVKRFFDIQLAHQILIRREKMRSKPTNNQEIIRKTLEYYYDYLNGEENIFNFERNRNKTEIAKLYNDITSTICIIQNKEFIPLEHINVKLDILTEKTLEHHYVLNNLIEKRTKVKINDEDSSKRVSSKLINILNREKEKKNDKPKTLKKERTISQKKENNYEK